MISENLNIFWGAGGLHYFLGVVGEMLNGFIERRSLAYFFGIIIFGGTLGLRAPASTKMPPRAPEPSLFFGG